MMQERCWQSGGQCRGVCGCDVVLALDPEGNRRWAVGVQFSLCEYG